MYKGILLGDSTVGKTSILQRKIFDKFHYNSDTTIGAGYYIYRFKNEEGKELKLELWDTAGQERFRNFAKLYYRGTDVAIIVFDISRPNFESLKYWIDEIKKNEPIADIIVVGNKVDLMETPITNGKMGEIDYIATSALTNYNIDILFDKIVEKLDPNKVMERDKVPIYKFIKRDNNEECQC